MGIPHIWVDGCQRERLASANQASKGDGPAAAVCLKALVDGKGLSIHNRAEGRHE